MNKSTPTAMADVVSAALEKRIEEESRTVNLVPRATKQTTRPSALPIRVNASQHRKISSPL